jgi:hypothetical protein
MENLRLLILKNDTYLVSEIEELEVEFSLPNCKLSNPYEIFPGVVLKPWPCYTDQREVLLHSDNILTITSPNDAVVKAYAAAVPSVIEEEVDEVLQER